MKSRAMSKGEVRKILTYDRDLLFKNPLEFDCPPPNFEKSTEFGWTLLAKAIVANTGGLGKYIDYAKKWKLKEEEWKTLPFIKQAVSFTKNKKKNRLRSKSNPSEDSDVPQKSDK